MSDNTFFFTLRLIWLHSFARAAKESIAWNTHLRDPVSILHKSIAGRYRSVRVADGPITARCRFIKNASLVGAGLGHRCPYVSLVLYLYLMVRIVKPNI